MLDRDPRCVSPKMLRENAIALGLHDLAIVYGWSMLKISEEMIVCQLKALQR